MNLGSRKLTYLVLGLGALGSAYMALVGMVFALAYAGQEVLLLQSIGGLLGVVCGIVALANLPVSAQLIRVGLTVGILIGCVSLGSALVMYWSNFFPDFDRPVRQFAIALYVWFLPMFVGIALVVELWLAQESPDAA